MNYSLCWAFYVVFTLNVWIISAQSAAGIYLTISDGLASNTIYDIKQDEKGYIWIGHAKGISRYDGKKFKHYYNNIQSSRSLTSIYFDYKGRVWCQNFAGEVLYIENDQLRIETRIEKMSNYFPIHVLQKRYLYYNTDKAVMVFDIQKGYSKTIHAHHNYIHVNSCVDSLYYYFTTSTGATYKTSPDLPVQKVNEIAKDYRNQLFFKLKDSFYIFHKVDKEYYVIHQNSVYKRKLNNKSTFLHSIRFNEHKKQVYLLCSDGVDILDVSSGKITPLMQGVTTSAFYEDKHQNIWIGTQGKGIIFISNPNIKKSMQ